MATVEKPLVVITGPTASGKTALAIELAKKYGGEIICADSRTIYKGMDIGTAKPTPEERDHVRHHLLDVVEPGERYTAADFQRDAMDTIARLRKKDKIPFLVGGTGLYIDAVVREYEWPEWSEDESKREGLENLSIEALQSMIKKQQLDMPINHQNKRHLINTIIRQGQTGKARLLPRENTIVVAIATDKTELDKRIAARAKMIFESRVVNETKALAQRYGWESEAMKSNIYPIIKRMLDGELTREEAINEFIKKDRQLAKRQLTWLRRYDYVQWLSLDDARVYIERVLKQYR